MPSTILSTVYASAPTGYVPIDTLEIKVSGQDPVYICNGYVDVTATLETNETVTFEAGNLVVALPRRDDTGQQSLKFAMWDVQNRAQEMIEAAIEADEQSFLVYRRYLQTDLSSPADGPVLYTMLGGQIQGLELQIEAGYYDLLNTSYPRERYTQRNAPGLKYL